MSPPPGRPSGRPAPPPAGPAFLLAAVGRTVRADLDRLLAEHDLSLPQLSALGHLVRAPGLSYSELARRAGVTPQSMQTTLRHLEARGAVARDTEPGRGRTARLVVTAAGLALRKTGTAVIDAADRALRAELPDGLADDLTRALSVLFLARLGRDSDEPAR